MRFTVIVLLALLLLVPVAAQDDLVEIPLGGAYAITIPEDWEETENSGNGYYWETDSSIIRIRQYGPVDQIEFGIDGLEGLLELLAIDIFGARSVDTDAIQAIDFGDYEGVNYTFEEVSEGNRYMRTILAYISDDNFIITGYIRPLSGHDLNEDDVNSMKAALETVVQQDTYIMHEGTQFDIIEGWELTRDYNGDFVITDLTNGTLHIAINLWPGYGAMVGFDEPGGLLAYAFTNGDTFDDYGSFDRSKMGTTRVAGFDAILYTHNADRLNARGTYPRSVIELILPNNGVLTAAISSATPDEPIDAVYEVLDIIQPGTQLVCALFADPGIRIRAAASTDSELVRQTEDETLIAVSKTVDSAGNTWFDITEGWVRSDVIYHEQAACAPIPTR
jgi:hypothetical protein